MSLSGVLDQSKAEQRGFASLLQQKLRQLHMEDDMEWEVGHHPAPSPPRPASCGGGRGRGQLPLL
jgi:hypothetical protein